jgi:ribosomal protein S27AE
MQAAIDALRREEAPIRAPKGRPVVRPPHAPPRGRYHVEQRKFTVVFERLDKDCPHCPNGEVWHIHIAAFPWLEGAYACFACGYHRSARSMYDQGLMPVRRKR